jgi:hypothetical protein
MIRLICFAMAMFIAMAVSVDQASALRVVDREYVFDKLSDFELCQQEAYTGAYCMDALKRWLSAHEQDSFAAAKLVRKHMNAYNAVPFFAAVKDKSGDFCKDHDLELAVVSGLALPADDSEVLPQAKELAFGACFADLKDGIKKEFSDSNVFANSCHHFLKEGSLGGMQTKKCEALQ